MARRFLWRSLRETLRQGRSRVGPGDMVLGLVADGGNVGRRVLQHLGVELAAARQLWGLPVVPGGPRQPTPR